MARGAMSGAAEGPPVWQLVGPSLLSKERDILSSSPIASYYIIKESVPTGRVASGARPAR